MFSNLFLLFLFVIGCYSQNTNVTLLKYCLIRETGTSSPSFRLKNYIDLTTMLSTDFLAFGVNWPPSTLNSNYGTAPNNIIWYNYQPPFNYPEPYSSTPCMIAYANPVPRSVALCEAQSPSANIGYFYFLCNDPYAISFLQSRRASSFKALGYFLTYLPNDIINGYNRLYFSVCGSGFNVLPYIELQPTTDGNADFVGPNSLCPLPNGGQFPFNSIPLFGLTDWPIVSAVSTSIVSTSVNSAFTKTYFLDNTQNNNVVTFTLGDVLSTSLIRNYQTMATQSSSTSMTHGFTTSFQETYTSEAGVKDVSSASWQIQLTQSESSSWTLAQSYENSQSTSTGYTITEDISLTGTVNVLPHCNLTILEFYSNITDIYLQQFLFNSIPSFTQYAVTTISPIGYKYISSNC